MLDDHFSMNDYSLRVVRDEGIDTLVSLINEAYSYQDVIKGEPRTNPSHLRKRVAETNFYVITHGDKIIGCVYVEPRGSALHFGLLALIPEYRRRGIAQNVMDAITAYTQANNLSTIDLDYMSLAPWLKTYYEKLGFAETGEVVKWGNIDLIHMNKHVHI